MDPFTLMALGMVPQLAFGTVGKILGDMDEAKARELIQKSMDETGKIDVPTLQSLTQEVGQSPIENYAVNPELRGAQYGALSRYAELARGGTDAETEADLAAIQNKLARVSAGERNAALRAQAQRGASGGGASLAAALSGQQAAAEQANQTGLGSAADAARRRFQALQAQAGLAGQVRGQEFTEEERKAAAHDAIARYNADARRHGAQQYFQNQLEKTGVMSGMRNQLAGNYQRGAEQQRQFWSGLGKAGSEAMRPTYPGATGTQQSALTQETPEERARRLGYA